MERSIPQNVGVDISKARLDAHAHPCGETRRFDNDARGLKALLAWLSTFVVARVVFEPTGPYHHAFERRLGEAGLPLAKVNPRRSRRFAEALGQHAKTDVVDAAMLARFGALLEPPARPAASRVLDEMKELQIARCALVKDRVAARNRVQTRRSALLRRQSAERLRQIERQLSAIDVALRALIVADPDLARRFEILLSIPGLGEISAIAILVEMPELGAIENKCAASLAGLAPMARDSGKRAGRRFIRGGRAYLRQALYMPALVAMRFNPSLKAKYQALTAAGKPAKVAVTAIMRKLLILANALLRDGREWKPSMA